MTTDDRLDATLAALAHPIRRAIVSRLASGETTVTELARPFDVSLPAVSKHLKVLEEAGLVTRGRDAQWRPCRLETEPLGEVAEWVEELQRRWVERLDRLDHYLHELQEKERQNDRESE